MDTRLLLLFIGDKPTSTDWIAQIDEEIQYCTSSKKSTLKEAIEADVVEIARTSEYGSVTWKDIVEFNGIWSMDLDTIARQVELRLLSGFDEALNSTSQISLPYLASGCQSKRILPHQSSSNAPPDFFQSVYARQPFV